MIEKLKDSALKNKEKIIYLLQENKELKEEIEDLKHKTYLTIRHLVEDVIEVQEKEIESLKKETEVLKQPRFAKDSFVRAVQTAIKNSPKV